MNLINSNCTQLTCPTVGPSQDPLGYVGPYKVYEATIGRCLMLTGLNDDPSVTHWTAKLSYNLINIDDT